MKMENQKLLPPPYKIEFKFSSFIMTEGNCKKCAYSAAVMAAATGSIGATDKHVEAYTNKVLKWAKVIRVIN